MSTSSDAAYTCPAGLKWSMTDETLCGCGATYCTTGFGGGDDFTLTVFAAGLGTETLGLPTSAEECLSITTPPVAAYL
ncbi:hypothetical protein Avbf_09323 [Armadillidium vulgare]|nr:hypothetical protein Avbf_09323 [Armadillidium vulgare]